VTASPGQVAPGQLVTLSGSGFPAGGNLQEQLFSTPVQLGTTRTDGRGRFRTSVRIPVGTTPGIHTIRVSVIGGNQVAETTVVVTSPPAPLLPLRIGSLVRTGTDIARPTGLAVALVLFGAALVGLEGRGDGPLGLVLARRRRRSPRRMRRPWD
jgi:hypothetical protein